MSSCDLSSLPLRRSAVIAIGGNSAHTLAKRLAHHARSLKPRLKVHIGTPEKMPDAKALWLVIPSMSRELNRFLDRSGISGVINALDECRFYFIDAATGQTTRYELPALPRAVNDLINELYA